MSDKVFSILKKPVKTQNELLYCINTSPMITALYIENIKDIEIYQAFLNRDIRAFVLLDSIPYHVQTALESQIVSIASNKTNKVWAIKLLEYDLLPNLLDSLYSQITDPEIVFKIQNHQNYRFG